MASLQLGIRIVEASKIENNGCSNDRETMSKTS